MKFLVSFICLFSFVFSSALAKIPRAHKIFQVSTFAALLNGVYDGDFSIKNLREFGDFGFGSVNDLDGELIAVQGEYYQIDPKGNLKPATSQMQTPFACVCFFEPQKTFNIKVLNNLDALQGTLEEKFYNVNIPYAFRINGTFPLLKLRSLSPQVKPYRKYPEVVKEQYEFELKDATGSLVAFWYPSYLTGINVPSLHVYFASEDRKKGGHVLDLKINTATVKMMEINNLEIQFPSSRSFAKADLEGDQSKAIKAAELR